MLMDFYIDAFRKYAQFEGKATRQQYWMFVLINFFIGIGFGFVGALLKTELLYSLYSLAVFIPSLAISIRRLHDINKSGWWILISLVPLIGWIWFIILMAQPSVATAQPVQENIA